MYICGIIIMQEPYKTTIYQSNNTANIQYSKHTFTF